MCTSRLYTLACAVKSIPKMVVCFNFQPLLETLDPSGSNCSLLKSELLRHRVFSPNFDRPSAKRELEPVDLFFVNDNPALTKA
jgi:hypothetical protein